MMNRLPERFIQKVRVDDVTGCWVWIGARFPDGYGRVRFGGHGGQRAHRVVYEMLVGPLGDLELDHACHVKACVAPAHLRPATRKQNSENRRCAQRNSHSGIRGVYERRGKWWGHVQHNKRTYHLGPFETALAAEAATRARRLELFTHNAVDRLGA